MCIHLPFKYKKATQALNFFAICSGGKVNKMKALKLIFFADRYHLRKFGRPITNCDYTAMDFGPVASQAKDIAEFTDFASKNSKDYAKEYIKKINKYTLESIKSPELKVFSKSDIEALQFAWDKFGGIDKYELCDITHAYPEWKKHEATLKYQDSVPMDYEDFFKDPPHGFLTCFDLNNNEKQERLAYVKEISKIEKLWKQ